MMCDLPVDSWRQVAGYLDDDAESCAALGCLNRSANAASRDERIWRGHVRRDYLPRDQGQPRERYENFVSRFDERRVEKSPSSLALDRLAEKEEAVAAFGAGKARANYFSWARGKPVDESVMRHAHSLRDGDGAVLYGSRVNALVLDPTSSASCCSKSCWSCGGDGVIHLWDFFQGSRVLSIRGAHQPKNSNFKQVNNMGVECADSCGPQTLVTGGCDKGISLWDSRSGRRQEVWNKQCAHFDEVLSVKCSRTLPVIVSGGADDCVRVWDVRYLDDPLLELDTLHGGSVFCIEIDEDRKMVYTGSGDKTISLWDLGTGHWYAQAHGHTGDVYSIKRGEERILSASDDGTVREWRLEEKKKWFSELHCVSTLGITADLNGPSCDLELRDLDGGKQQRRSFQSVTHMTCLELLGEGEGHFLGGCWSGDIVLGKLHGRLKPFSQPTTKHAADEGKEEFQEYLIADVSHTPVTAIAATNDCVISGCNNGAVRFSRMVPSDEA